MHTELVHVFDSLVFLIFVVALCFSMGCILGYVWKEDHFPATGAEGWCIAFLVLSFCSYYLGAVSEKTYLIVFGFFHSVLFSYLALRYGFLLRHRGSYFDDINIFLD